MLKRILVFCAVLQIICAVSVVHAQEVYFRNSFESKNGFLNLFFVDTAETFDDRVRGFSIGILNGRICTLSESVSKPVFSYDGQVIAMDSSPRIYDTLTFNTFLVFPILSNSAFTSNFYNTSDGNNVLHNLSTPFLTHEPRLYSTDIPYCITDYVVVSDVDSWSTHLAIPTINGNLIEFEPVLNIETNCEAISTKVIGHDVVGKRLFVKYAEKNFNKETPFVFSFGVIDLETFEEIRRVETRDFIPRYCDSTRIYGYSENRKLIRIVSLDDPNVVEFECSLDGFPEFSIGHVMPIKKGEILVYADETLFIVSEKDSQVSILGNLHQFFSY